MPHGKPAGIPCIQLTADLGCALFGSPDRPKVCIGLKPGPVMCGSDRSQALAYLSQLEILTLPTTPAAQFSAAG